MGSATRQYSKEEIIEKYQIKSMICPCCESKPIGKMYLVKNIKENKYIWKCSENTSHEIEFDYKQKF